MVRKVIGTGWDRNNRNSINDNFEFLFERVGRVNVLADDLEGRTRQNAIDIAELYGSTGQALDAAEEARTEANNAGTQANRAEEKADYAEQQGDYAKTVADQVLIAPHMFHDEDAGVTYNYGFKVKDRHLVFMYEEVQ